MKKVGKCTVYVCICACGHVYVILCAHSYFSRASSGDGHTLFLSYGGVVCKYDYSDWQTISTSLAMSVSVSVCVCVCVCMCVCVCICVCVCHIHTCSSIDFSMYMYWIFTYLLNILIYYCSLIPCISISLVMCWDTC